MTTKAPTQRKPAQTATGKQSQRLEEPKIAIDGELIDANLAGYCPIRVDVLIPKSARENLKRLALTLDVAESRLKDGTLVQNKVSKAVAWLIEKFSDEISKSEHGVSEK